jgi:hypothetical protein
VDPSKKLRGLRSFTPPRFETFIPPQKSAPAGGVIHGTYERARATEDRKEIDSGNAEGTILSRGADVLGRRRAAGDDIGAPPR